MVVLFLVVDPGQVDLLLVGPDRVVVLFLVAVLCLRAVGPFLGDLYLVVARSF